MLKNAFDVQHPFFKPLWRRILVVVACFGWAVFELIFGGEVWALIFAAAGAWCAHQFFFAFDPKEPDERKGGDET